MTILGFCVGCFICSSLQANECALSFQGPQLFLLLHAVDITSSNSQVFKDVQQELKRLTSALLQVVTPRRFLICCCLATSAER
jgi:hypothetical protein